MSAFDDLTLLNVLVSIVESGSISAAARRLKIPQPTLSRHLRALEESCGTTLLHRDTHQMTLTETGRRLLADARMILSFAADAEQRIHDEQTELSGHLRLFATIDFGQFAGTRIIAAFMKANPKITVELGYTNRPLHMIHEGCDAGMVAGKITDESLVAKPVGKIGRILVASPEVVKSRPAAKKPGDLKSWPWVGLSGTQFGGPKVVTLCHPRFPEQTLRIAPHFITEGVTSQREAARSGLGLAALPLWLIHEDLRSGRLVRVLTAWEAKPLPAYIVYSSQRILPVRVRAFIDFALVHVGAELSLDKTAAKNHRSDK